MLIGNSPATPATEQPSNPGLASTDSSDGIDTSGGPSMDLFKLPTLTNMLADYPEENSWTARPAGAAADGPNGAQQAEL